jgi:uncharacterized protein
MAYYLCRLTPPRPSFAQDMTDDERAIMHDHVAYWRELLAAGRVVVFGPVADPAGAWGLSVIEADDEREVESMLAGDPVSIRGGDGFQYQVLAMPGGFARPMS